MTSRGVAALLALLAIAVPARPQDTTTAPAPSSSTTSSTAPAPPVGGEAEPIDVGFTSPRSTMRGFLVASHAGDYDKAAEYLDLRRVPRTHRETTGPMLARQLSTVLDRTLWIDPETLSDAPEGDRDDGLAPRRELVGTIRMATGSVDIVLERIAEADGSLDWKIASSVVARIPQLYAAFGDAPFVNVLPAFMTDVTILALRLWQWVALVVLALLGVVVAWVTSGPLLRLLSIAVPEDRRHQSDRLIGGVAGPLRLLVVIAVVAAGLPWLALSVPAAAALTLLRRTATTVGVTWLGLRVVDAVARIADDRLRTHGRAAAVSVIPLGRRTVKVFVAIIAGIAIVQNLGYNATGIIAGLGVGGLALALAAQKTVENLFGGVMLITDQPVRVGDLCRFGTRTGVVEDIGLRSTRIRTPERTIVSVPNADFSATQIENLAVRDRMQLLATIGLRLDATAAQLRRVLADVRDLLAAVPRVDRASASVRFVGVTPTAFELQISAYVLTRDWDEFLAVREEFLLQMLEVVDRAGTGLAGQPAPPPPRA